MFTLVLSGPTFKRKHVYDTVQVGTLRLHLPEVFLTQCLQVGKGTRRVEATPSKRRAGYRGISVKRLKVKQAKQYKPWP